MRRYYWLKLKENFFEDDTIKYIESLKNGEKLCLFYLKLCCKALKDEGHLIRFVGKTFFPYDEKSLAQLTNTDEKTTKDALKLFLEIGLIERLESGELFLTQIKEMIGSETETAERMRKSRQKKILEQRNNATEKRNNVITMLQNSYNEVTKELQDSYKNVTDIIESRDKEIKRIDNDLIYESDFATKSQPENQLLSIPSFEEVFNFYHEKKLDIPPETFYKYNLKNNWKLKNGEKMQNWKGAYLAMNKQAFPDQNYNNELTLEEARANL